MEKIELVLQIVGWTATVLFFLGAGLILWDIWKESKEHREIKS